MTRCFPVILLLMLSSCTVLPERAPVNLYQLPPSSLSSSAEGEQMIGLRLARPATSDALGSTRMLVMTEDHSYQAYSDARWAAPVPVLWRDWMMDAFWRDGRVSQLSTDSERLQAGYELGGMLRALHTEFSDGQSEAVIRYDARLVDIRSREIVASRRFEAREPVAGTDAGQAVAAMGLAADRMVAEIIDWVLSRDQ